MNLLSVFVQVKCKGSGLICQSPFDTKASSWILQKNIVIVFHSVINFYRQ